MSTLTSAGLETLLGGLSLKVPVPQCTNTKILNDPVDISRSYLADILHEITHSDILHTYNAVQLPAVVDGFSGDLAIILPKLAREVGVDVENLREMICKQVRK
jgi:arginyl-tRNA synthetase